MFWKDFGNVEGVHGIPEAMKEVDALTAGGMEFRIIDPDCDLPDVVGGGATHTAGGLLDQVVNWNLY
jgi:hypothetical protein